MSNNESPGGSVNTTNTQPATTLEEVVAKLSANVKDAPIRQRAAHVPRPNSSFERCCESCGASFIGLAFDGTGQRGIWASWGWYCSVECAGDKLREGVL